MNLTTQCGLFVSEIPLSGAILGTLATSAPTRRCPIDVIDGEDNNISLLPFSPPSAYLCL
jgi:hypothetical protein